MTVHQPNGDDGKHARRSWGHYEVGENDVVRFRPMFPFDPGREYQVTFSTPPSFLARVKPKRPGEPPLS